MTSKTRHNASRIVFVLIVGVILAYGALASLAYGFAAAGGEIAVQSPSVEIDSDSVGDVVTIGGSKNIVTMQRPYEPESEQHQRGELAFLMVLTAAGFGVMWYWWHRMKNGFDFIMVSEKEPI